VGRPIKRDEEEEEAEEGKEGKESSVFFFSVFTHFNGGRLLLMVCHWLVVGTGAAVAAAARRKGQRG